MPSWLTAIVTIAAEVPQVISVIESIIKAIQGAATTSEGVKMVAKHLESLPKEAPCAG